MLQTVINDMKSRLKDPDIARLFENTFPNTLGDFSPHPYASLDVLTVSPKIRR